MRSSNKSRSRNKSSNRNRNVGNIINRVFDSAGPEGKVRGTPQQIIEKYQTLTRDAQLSGDRVAAENFQQHAEHYLRLLTAAQREQAERQAADARNRPNSQQQDQGGDGGQDQQRRDRPDQAQGQERGDRKSSGGGEQAEFAPVIDSGQNDSGLVETPESKSVEQADGQQQPARRTRSRRAPKAQDDQGGDQGGKDAPKQPDVAEGSTVS
jgi:hypothetical protein